MPAAGGDWILAAGLDRAGAAMAAISPTSAPNEDPRPMPLLAAKAYNPPGVVTWPTTALLAMTALDTANLRNTITAPASGIVEVRARGVVHGATTFPQVHLGILNGATELVAVAAGLTVAGTALATTQAVFDVTFPVVGLTAGQSYTLDLAYSVDTLVASTAIKCGGASDTTANNRFGALIFEIWQAT